MYDAIVVGSGAAGTFVALGLSGAKTLVLDAGVRFAETSSLNGNLYDLRKRQSLFAETVGTSFEALAGMTGRELSPKVKSPLMRPVFARPPGAPDVRSAAFVPLLSYAAGGLANAWGAQVYRFDDTDLRGFPLRAADLNPFYDELTEHIGISGTEDDLARFHGSARGLQPPLELSAVGRELLDRYTHRAEDFKREGIHLGRPRLAVLSRDHGDRTACTYDNLEFFRPRLRAVFTPAFTLEELVRRSAIEYRPGYLVETYRESEDAVEVWARPFEGGEGRTFRGRKLILCLGALNTARLVLHANKDTNSRLPLVETPYLYAPLVSLRRIGMPLEKRSFYSQLNLFYVGPLWPEPLVGMIYAVEGLLRADLLFKFPLAVQGCLAAAKYLLPAMALFQLYYPGEPHPSNTLGVDAHGNLLLRYDAPLVGGVEKHILRALRRTGYWSSPRLVHISNPGASVHYAGALPMRERPERRYETNRNGLLAGTKAVYVGDSAAFPRLPAKNLTFTIMANALRIGRALRAELVE
jgi:choline dehydrogenase-like flavoprotein